MRLSHRVAVPVLTIIVALATSAPAQADPVRCQREIVKRSAKFAEKKMKELMKCEDKVVQGRSTGPCPDAKASAKIAKEATKLGDAIAKKCGGSDRTCGTADDDSLASIGWSIGNCPNFEGGSCTNQINHCGDIADCLLCIDEAAVDQAISLYYDEFANSTDRTIVKCQRAIGKETAKFFDRKVKALKKCEDDILKGKFAGPCPDAKASVKIAKAEAKKVDKICKACGGADRTCGGGDDLTPAAIGFTANCPDVDVPNGPSCGGPIANLEDIVTCVDCVTEFKVDCMDAAAVPGLKSYPSECGGGGGGPTVTPTPTPPPGQTATPTPTPPPGTPTPTSTATPGPNCGNNTVDAGEECDGTDDALCPGQCTVNCTCPAAACQLPDPIPEVLSLVVKPGIDLDTGWTGVSHDIPGVDDAPVLATLLTNCDLSTSSPTCGQCDISGPVAFPGPIKNCACFNLTDRDASSLAACDPDQPSDCTSPESCECFYGPPLPISSGAVPVCVTNRFTAPVSGTANIADSGPNAGAGEAFVRLESSVHNGLAVDQPCPTCDGDATPRDGVKGGTCNGGAQAGLPCDVAGTNIFFGNASFDCLPQRAANIGNLDIIFDKGTTGTATLETTNGPNCTSAGAAGQQCFCDTCATAAAEPCNTNADCPGGTTCGGRRCIGGSNNGATCSTNSECPGAFCNRPGTPTARNQCQDGVCSPNPSDPDGANEGLCEAGPVDSVCSKEPFRGCTQDVDCNPPPAGNCGSCAPDQVCEPRLRQCFLDPIVRTGMPGTQMSIVVATFCIPPTSSQSVNQVAGLPGPGAVEQPTRPFRSGSQCGNGVLNSGEQCDPPNDAACPGECQIDCQCPAAAVCGDNDVNQPSEECDGTDDSACPGACQGDCTCGPFCGDNAVNQGSEQCDGTDDAACPGECGPTCQCPTCGDGVINQPSEQCDGGDDSACPGACQGDCTCGPFCGDGTVNQPSEQCDGSDTGTCPGTCDVDCTCNAFCGDNVQEAPELCDGTDDAACPGECQGDCTCPAIGTLTLVAKDGADLDTGWTGTSHDFTVQAGSTLQGEIGGCDGTTDVDCTFFANVGSFCSGDASINCTSSTQCPIGQSCVINPYGPPLPLSSGGVPVCVTNRFAEDVTGTAKLDTGDRELRVRLNSLVHLATDVSRPCPICNCGKPNVQDCEVGETGTCNVAPFNACTVGGTGRFGPTSNDCPPNPGTNVSGGGLDILFDPLSTGTVSFPTNQPCDGAGFTSQTCWCDGQTRKNNCNNACDGGDNDAQPCNSNADCPGGGTCTALCRQITGETVGEGECPAGPIESTCAGASEIGCSTNADCDLLGVGPCQSIIQRCFLDPIVRIGTPSTTSDIGAATFCIPATSSPAVNNTAGLPGPGAILLPNDVTQVYCGDGIVNRSQEECDGTDDSNCPGACSIGCLCQTTCGDGVQEFGEQCDPGGPGGSPPPDDAACPALCSAAGNPDECTCPALCGDGFVGPGEECDPGGPGGTPPPSDAACPGECLVTCQCTPPVCGNGEIESGEICELPATGCGPLQLCVACTQCVGGL